MPMNESLKSYQFQISSVEFELATIQVKMNAATANNETAEIKSLTQSYKLKLAEHEKLRLGCLDYLKRLKKQLPSKENKERWISMSSPDKGIDLDLEKTGKWVIFRKIDQIDTLWETIRDRTQDGQLGIQAKVSTMRKNPNFDSEYFVICVYTADCNNREELLKVREQLRALGVTEKIGYKTDAATHSGIYGSDDEFLLKI
jgi:hypothetical protein